MTLAKTTHLKHNPIRVSGSNPRDLGYPKGGNSFPPSHGKQEVSWNTTNTIIWITTG
jgi:hypothetical protein